MPLAAVVSSTIEQHTFPNGLVLVAEMMPGVQSAAFSLLLPAGAAYEGAAGLNLSGGAATMAAEWISRGAGPRDSRELLTALDNLGVSHAESAQTLHTSLAVATLGRNLEPALEIFADMVLRPHLDDDEVEPIRALCLQNLRSLEDDPGTKVIYELRRRHFPDPWGRPSPGTAEGVAALTPDQTCAISCSQTYRPNGAILGVAGAIDWPRLRDHRRPVVRRLEAAARAAGTGARRPDRSAIISCERPSRSRSRWPIPRRPSPAPTITGHEPPPRFWAVIPRPGFSPKSARNAGCATPCTPAMKVSSNRAAILCYAGTSADRAQQTLDVMLAEIDRLGREGVALDELDTMRAGLKSSLIMAQESSMSRSGSLASDWYFLGRVRPIEEIAASSMR